MKKLFPVLSAMLAVNLLAGEGAAGVNFSFLDPAYKQETITPSAPGEGLGWTPTGELVVRNGNSLYVYDQPAYNFYGDAVRDYTLHSIATPGSGIGMTNGIDGNLYVNEFDGIYRVDPVTFSATLLPNSVGGYYGIDPLPSGELIHTDGGSRVYKYDIGAATDTFIYDAGAFVDDLAVTPTGQIFLAVLGAARIDVINSSGALINSVADTHNPDGIAFGLGYAFANNTDGTITRYSFAGAGYTGAATEYLFASGGVYGDFASAGPDGALYVTQLGGPIDHPDSTQTFAGAIVRISLLEGGGFDPGTGSVPEPASFLVWGGLLGGVFLIRRRRTAK